MNASQDKTIDEIIEHVLHSGTVSTEDIPRIPLYMDQVTTFMESVLGDSRRFDKDKIMTKTMINNYAKNHLLPAPDKKKYSTDHIILLFFIYYMKNVLSINDISTLLAPITERYFQSQEEFSMSDIHREIFLASDSYKEYLAGEMEHLKKLASDTFENAADKDAEFLHLFSYISLLCYDVYLRKQIVEGLVDHLAELSKDN